MTAPVSSRESLASLLRRLRVEAQLSQEQLAERSGLSFRTISNIETGLRKRPRTATIRLLADALGASAEWRSLLQRVAQQDGLYLPAAPEVIGREDDIARLQRACDAHPFVCVTGPPGAGKTTLALFFANGVLGRYPGGVAFVPLDTIDDSALVLPVIARSLGISGPGSGPELRDAVVERLQIGRTLLVLDNIEHVLSAGSFVAQLLDDASQLRILATGRCPFGLRTEHEMALPPLSHEAAVSLFIQRASSVVNGYAPDATEREHIDRICTVLDRLPLALELAAIRLRSLSYEQVADRIWDLLRTGSSDRVGRHRALDTAISWSYDLLNERLQDAFRRFAVFTGGATAEGAQNVCGMDAADVDALVRQNLLVADGCGSSRRLRMLVTIREFATARLRESGEFEETARRHAHSMGEIAQDLVRRAGTDIGDCMARFENEQENFETALAWIVANREWETGIRMACALWRIWRIRSQHDGARQWFETLAQGTTGLADRALRALLLNNAADVFVRLGEIDAAERYTQELQEIAPALGDPLLSAWALVRAGMIELANGRREAGAALCERIFHEYAGVCDDALLAYAHTVCARYGVGVDASWHLELAFRYASSAKSDDLRAQLLSNLSDCFIDRNEYDRAQAMLDQSIELAEAIGYTRIAAHGRHNRAQILLNLGDTGAARPEIIQSLEFFSTAQFPFPLAGCLEESARLLGMCGSPDKHVKVLALATRYAGRLGPNLLEHAQADLDRLRTELGDRDFRLCWEIGGTLRVEEVLEMLCEDENVTGCYGTGVTLEV